MMKIVIGFIAGLLIGAAFGFLCACLIAANGEDRDE